MLEEDDALATKAASEEDQDGTRLERWTWFCGMDGFADLVTNISSCWLPTITASKDDCDEGLIRILECTARLLLSYGLTYLLWLALVLRWVELPSFLSRYLSLAVSKLLRRS